MMKRYTMLSAALLTIVSTSVLAGTGTLQPLKKDEVVKIIEGNTITTVPLATVDNQLINNTFTGYFDKNGKTQGKFASPVNNQPQQDEGTWTISNNGVLCITWEHWSDHKAGCAYVYGVSNAYIFIDQKDNTFQSIVLKKDGVATGNKLSQ